MLRRSLVVRGSLVCIIVLLLILILFMQYWPPEGQSQRPVMSFDGSVNLPGEAASLTRMPVEETFVDDPNDPRRKLKQKLVHLDLKGMPPLVSYYAELFPLLKKIGVTGILVEYEDMFPFSGPLASVTNRRTYTVKEVLQINQLAATSGLEVIPLIQTFGHLEFVLKTEEFIDLREVPRYPQVLCPSNNKSLELVKLMVDQVLALHHGVRYLHIGSDEVYFIGMCSACNARMERLQVDNPKVELFVQHVKSVAEYVIQRHARRVMMWDDEFRQVEESVIVKSGLGDMVDIVVWNYNEDVHKRLGPELWEKYLRVFPSIWIGSAFKGANHPNSMVVDEAHYLGNHRSWVKTMKEQAALVSFQGIILTGWQRYDHFSVLCEILTVAIPSLVTCMKYLNMSREASDRTLYQMGSDELHCGMSLRYCDYPGSKIQEHVLGLQKSQMELTQMKSQGVFQGWANEVNLRFHFSNPSHVENVLADVTRLKVELTHRKQNLVTTLSEVYPDWSVEEWMLTNFQPIAKEINHLYEGLARILDQQTFPVRPLTQPRNLNASGF